VTGADTEARVARGRPSLVARLRGGDERALEEVVRDFYPSMLALARGYTRTRAVADEVVQEAWIGVLERLDRFEGRSSLRPWVLQIVGNIARTRAVREARSLPFSAFDLDADQEEPAVEPERFPGARRSVRGTLALVPDGLADAARAASRSTETLELVKHAIAELPETQKIVITLRDVAGCSAVEVCDAVDVSPENQRVLLHRARATDRA
jgi:RNA polymerase sigma-70 factor (ECF subfamily)